MKNKEKEKAEQQNTEPAYRPLKDLNLIDDYMFDIATMDLEICKSIIELSLNIRIQEIRWKEGQKVIHNLPGKRGIRLDFYVKGMDGTVFNVEMQKDDTGSLPKRTRYYSALLDAPLLKSGERTFNRLPETYIIVICGFDLFGCGKYRYQFHYRCDEVPGLVLQNGLNVVFLNTQGENKNEVEPELVAFLRFVENSTAEEARQSEDPRIQTMYGKLNNLKNSEAVEVDYMTAEEYRWWIEEKAKREGLAKGREEGREEGQQLKLVSQVLRKLEKGYTPEETAEMLEENPGQIRSIYKAAERMAPDYNVEKVCALLAAEAKSAGVDTAEAESAGTVETAKAEV